MNDERVQKSPRTKYDGLPSPSLLQQRTMGFQARRCFSNVRWASKPVAASASYDGIPSPSLLQQRTMGFQARRCFNILRWASKPVA